MRTKRHWEECKLLPSYYAAQRVALHLKELAKGKGYDPKGIKVLTKEDAHKRGRISDSEVLWDEGPVGWPRELDFVEYPGVWLESHATNSVSFYDIAQQGLKGIEHESN